MPTGSRRITINSGGAALRQCFTAVLCLTFGLSIGCNREKKEAFTEHPRLSAQVVMQDVTFRSSALQRDMQYRVILPANLFADKKLPVVYLLHGGGGGFHGGGCLFPWRRILGVSRRPRSCGCATPLRSID